MRIRIGTRSSKLALYQAALVQGLLKAAGHEGEIVPITTQGDTVQDRPLVEIGGKGLFVKEIEDALLKGACDVAVHSLKDVPYYVPSGLVIHTFLEREDPRDVFVGEAKDFDLLRKGARVGTGSLRRAVQLKRLRPDIEIVPIRGNVETRIRKIKEENLAGVVLAYAGLKRLGLDHLITTVFSPYEVIPAVGQGVIAIEHRKADTHVCDVLEGFNHADTARAVMAERIFLEMVEGSCTVPMGGYCEAREGSHHMVAFIASPDGKEYMKSEALGDNPMELGTGVAEDLVRKGARRLLER